MTGFFSKLFGAKKTTAGKASSTTGLVEEIMDGLISRGEFHLDYTVRTDGSTDMEEITVELSGTDEVLLTEKEGALLDSFQLFIKRVVQHQMPEARVNVSFDCNGFREDSNRELVELAEKLRDKCIEQGRSVYLRALPPKDRKVVHQHLATDERVRSRSVGDGLYKKIKIYPAKAGARDNARTDDRNDEEFATT